MPDAVVGSAVWELDLDDKKYKEGLSDASTQMKGLEGTLAKNAQSISNNFGSLGKKMSLAVTAPLVGFGVLAAKEFGELNASVERAGSFVDATTEQMNGFREAAINAARGTAFSFTEVADALGSFVGGEVSAEEATQELSSVIDLALVAKLGNLQDAVNLGSLALTVFKEDGMEVSNVMDIIGTVASSVTSETEAWSNALVNSSGAAKAAGFSFKELNVLFSAMVRGGADVNLIWSAFNSAITQVQAPTKGTIDALKEVGLSVTEMQEALASGPIELLEFLKVGFDKANASGQGMAFLTHVLGSQAAPEFALALGLTNEELQETAGWFENIDGVGATMVARIREAVPALDQLTQSFREISITLAPSINKIFSFLADALGKLSGWLSQLSPKQKEMLVWFGLALAAIGPLLVVLASLAAAIAFLATPIGAIVVAIAVLGTALGAWIGIMMYKWDELVQTFKQTPERIRAALAGVYNAITGAFRGAFDWIQKKAAEAGEALQKLNPFHRESPSLVDNVIRGMDIIKDQFSSLGDMSLPTANIVAGTQGVATSSAVNNFNVTVNEKVDVDYFLDKVASHLGVKGLQANAGIS